MEGERPIRSTTQSPFSRVFLSTMRTTRIVQHANRLKMATLVPSGSGEPDNRHQTQRRFNEQHRLRAMIGDRPALEKWRSPAVHQAWFVGSTTPLPDDVKIKPLPSWSFKRDHVWADGFQALADVTRPGERVADFAVQLYDASSQPDLSSRQKDVFLTIGATFDMLSVMVPGVMPMKSFGIVAGLVAKTLRNDTISATDLLDMNNVFRNVMDMRTGRDGGSMVRKEDGNIEQVAPKRVLLDPEGVTGLYFQKVFGASSPPSEISETAPKMLAEAFPEVPPEVEPDEVPIEAHGKVVVDRGSAMLAPAVARPDSRVSVGREGADDMAAGEAQQLGAPPEGQLLGPPDPDQLSSPEALANRAVGGADAATSHPWKDLPSPLDYAMVDGIPLCLQPDDQVAYTWQQLPLSWYRARVLPEDPHPLFAQAGPSLATGRVEALRPRSLPDAIFTVNHRDYVTIDGYAYAIRDVSPYSLQVYKPTDVSLPPLPVEHWNSAWRFKTILSRHVSEIAQAPGEDGYIRVNNKKYLTVGDKIVQTQRARIVGEERIARVAQAVMEPLPGAGACGFIQWIEGKTLIEGRQGYYLVRHDAELGMIVQDAELTQRFAVHYDYLLGQWRVGTTHETVMAGEQVYQGSIKDGVPQHEHLETMAQQYRAERLSEVASRDPTVRRDSLYDWRRLDEMPFSRHWPLLATSVPKALQHLGRRQLVRANRRHPAASARTDFVVYSIDNIRDAGYRLLPGKEAWSRMGLRAKQQIAAAFTADIYDNFYFLAVDDTAEAMCSEMTELAMIEIGRVMRAGRSSLFGCQECNVEANDVHFLELKISETVPIGRTGRAHVVLLAFKSAETMEEAFGPVLSQASSDLSTLKEMQNGDFRSFVGTHKDQLILIDAWGPNKVIDFGGRGGVDAAVQAFEDNLREASFGDVTATIGFSVAPFVPPLSGTRARHLKPAPQYSRDKH